MYTEDIAICIQYIADILFVFTVYEILCVRMYKINETNIPI